MYVKVDWTIIAFLCACITIVLMTSVASKPVDSSSTDGTESEDEPVIHSGSTQPTRESPSSPRHTETNENPAVRAVPQSNDTQPGRSPRTTPNGRVDAAVYSADVSEADLRPTEPPRGRPDLPPSVRDFSRMPFIGGDYPYAFSDYPYYFLSYAVPYYYPTIPPCTPSYVEPERPPCYWPPFLRNDPPWMPISWDGPLRWPRGYLPPRRPRGASPSRFP